MDRILDPAQAVQFSHVVAADLPAALTGLSDSVAFVWIERGIVRCQRAADAGPMVVPARTLVVVWCGALRTWTRERRAVRLHVVFAPYAWCVAREPGDALLRRLQRGEVMVDRRAQDDAGEWIRRWAAPGAMTEARRLRALVCELEARLLAFDEGGAASSGGPRESTAQQKARAMARHIEEMFPAQVSLRALADYARLAPGYAATVFRTCHGETPLAYLNRLRIAHARRLLAMTDLKVIEVGHEAGFATTSRFYAQFCRVCGLAPAAFRVAARQAARPDGIAPPAAGDRNDPSAAGLMPVRHVILWVDDNPNGNFEERKRLFSFGILCDSYVTNASAVAAFRTGRYELVVSDINRPAGAEDGWALLRALRAVNPKAAVLLYTGRIHAEVERAAVRRGAAGAFDRSGPLIAAILRLLARAPAPSA